MKGGEFMAAERNIIFRLISPDEYVFKDKEGVIRLRNVKIDGYVVDNDEYIYAGQEGFYEEDEDDLKKRSKEKIAGLFGYWEKDDLRELLRIGIANNVLSMVEDSLQFLYDLDDTEGIHLAIRRGLRDIWESKGQICLAEKFQSCLGYLLGLVGTTEGDFVLVQLGNALLHLEEIPAQLILARYIEGV